MRKVLLIWLGLDALIIALLARGGGDPSTCEHPAIRADGPVVW